MRVSKRSGALQLIKLLDKACITAVDAGWSGKQFDRYLKKALSGDIDKLLITTLEQFGGSDGQD